VVSIHALRAHSTDGRGLDRHGIVRPFVILRAAKRSPCDFAQGRLRISCTAAVWAPWSRYTPCGRTRPTAGGTRPIP